MGIKRKFVCKVSRLPQNTRTQNNWKLAATWNTAMDVPFAVLADQEPAVALIGML